MALQLALPRNGPGSSDATRAAFAHLPPLPSSPRILVPGCGQAPEAFDLLSLCDGRIVAVDLLEPFLDKAKARAEREGVDPARLSFQKADMSALSFTPGSFDLIWSEGAIYHLGFGRGLGLWRSFLKPHGCAVISECSWLTDAPSDEIKNFWTQAYPSMGTVSSNTHAAQCAGYDLLATMTLPPQAWWADYYSPMRKEAAKIKERPDAGAAERSVVEEAEQEIELYERFGDQYGYVFYILRRTD